MIISYLIARSVEKHLTEEDKREIVKMGDNHDLIALHFGLGTWIRNRYLFWYPMADMTSGTVIWLLYRRLRKKFKVAGTLQS